MCAGLLSLRARNEHENIAFSLSLSQQESLDYGQENIIWLSSDMNSLLQPLPLSYLFVFFLLQPLAFLLHLLLPVEQHKGDRG
jgi:hypothetical protein